MARHFLAQSLLVEVFVYLATRKSGVDWSPDVRAVGAEGDGYPGRAEVEADGEDGGVRVGLLKRGFAGCVLEC